MLVNLKVRTCIVLVLLLFTGAMFLSNGVAWMGLDSSNGKLEQVNDAYSDQATQLNRAYIAFLRGRLLLANSLMDMQQGKTEQATSQAQRADTLMREGNEQLDAFRKVPRMAGSEALVEKLETSYRQFDDVYKRQAAALANLSIQEYLDLNDAGGAANTAFREAVYGVLQFVDTRTNELVAQAESDHRISRTVTIALLAITLLLALGCWIFINRTVLRPLHQAGDHFDKISGGDFTGRIDVRSSNEIGQLFAAIKRMQESLTRTVATVRRGVDEINVGAREISAGNTDLSSRTEQQAASLEETAASM
ncbi:Tar ligand binding domain-containing protein, partial [Achromobacter sp. MY14]